MVNFLELREMDYAAYKDNLRKRYEERQKKLRKLRKNASKLSPGDKVYSIGTGVYLGKFRRGPIWGISSRGWASVFRHPGTRPERRRNLADKEFVRGKRLRIPSNWDDVARSDYKGGNISWKRRKKTRHQWGGKHVRVSEALD